MFWYFVVYIFEKLLNIYIYNIYTIIIVIYFRVTYDFFIINHRLKVEIRVVKLIIYKPSTFKHLFI